MIVGAKVKLKAEDDGFLDDGADLGKLRLTFADDASKTQFGISAEKWRCTKTGKMGLP